MAFQKTITLPDGRSGDYIRLGKISWDRDVAPREVTACFALFTSDLHAAAADTGDASAITTKLAKLTLRGAKFDEYLATPVLAGVLADDPFRAQLYAAAKAEPDCVVCDLGGDVFAVALDV